MTANRAGRRLAPHRSLITLALAAALAGCRTSPKPTAIFQATSPYGEQISVTLKDGRSHVGELLAVTDTALIVMVQNRVAIARAVAIALARTSRFRLGYAAGTVRKKELDNARRGARFPYGMSPEVLSALLTKTSQSSPDDLTRTQQ